MRLRTIAAVIWPCALVGWLYEKTAHLGFNILDEGLVLSYTHRILDGQVPHRDFISPRPVGSSLLHIPDLLIPLPVVLAGRLVDIAVIVAFSVLVAWLVYRCPPTQWGPAHIAGAAVAAFVNLHTILETEWYTSDGLLLCAGAFLLLDAGLRRDSRRLRVAAFLVAGVAVTTKQSFAPAPVAMLAWLWWSQRGTVPPRARVSELLTSACLGALPMLLYVAVIGAFGGLGDVVDQMTSGKLVWGRSLFEIIGVRGPGYGRPPYVGHFPWEVALAALAVGVAARKRANPAIRFVLGLVLVVLVGRLCFHQDLGADGSWSLEVMWALVLVVVVRALVARRVDGTALLALLLGWMAMLSWGYDVPAMAAGSLALASVAWAFEGLHAGEFALRRPLADGLVAVLALAVFVFGAAKELHARRAEPYFDRPASELRYSIAGFSSDLRGIKTSAPIVSYLAGLRDCRRRYPAHWTAVLPDNAGLYSKLGMHNPFPIDWFFRQDYRGQEGRILDAARKLDAEGDYLVLLQSISGFFLNQFRDGVPPANRHSPVTMLIPGVLYDSETGKQLVAALHGRHIVCGSFLGIWSPARS